MTNDPDIARDWFERFEGAGLDGVIAKPLDGDVPASKRTMLKVKHQRTADCAVGGFRVHKDGEGVGSLMLGLFDDDGSCTTSASPRLQRRARASSCRRAGAVPRATRWAITRGASGPKPPTQQRGQAPARAGNRWNAGKDMSWEPLARPRRRGRVRALQGDRFRHATRFRLAARPRAASCTYAQLERPVPELLEVFGV